MTTTNGLRMPMAEWFFRLSEARVPYQAWSLAMCAVLFKVTDNEQLAVLCAMDSQGAADKTYNKWKKYLSDNGWVRVTAVTVGRLTTIEVTPAIDTIPVTFTDHKPRDPERFASGKSYEREVEITDEDDVSTVKVTDDAVKITDEPCSDVKVTVEADSSVKVTDVSRAYIESSSKIVKHKQEDNPHTPPKGADLIAEAFEVFWTTFPPGRKQGKGAALDAFRRIVNGRHRMKLHATAADIIAGVKQYAASKYDPDFVPMPSTWLNEGRWQDDVQAGPTKRHWWQDEANVARVTEAQWRGSIAKNANGHWPVDKLSPVPGTPNCKVPETIIHELRLLERYDENGFERADWKGRH